MDKVVPLSLTANVYPARDPSSPGTQGQCSMTDSVSTEGATCITCDFPSVSALKARRMSFRTFPAHRPCNRGI